MNTHSDVFLPSHDEHKMYNITYAKRIYLEFAGLQILQGCKSAVVK